MWTISVETDPPGADVYLKRYNDPDGDWQYLGRSPFETYGCFCYFRWRVQKTGFSTFEGAQGSNSPRLFSLVPEGTVPERMVRVPGGVVQTRPQGSVSLGDYFIDRYEVTNREFKAFVDAGGYQNRSHWRQPFVKDGKTLTWDGAMAEFRDETGRPGPSTWEYGGYPEGQDDHPVGGVSWYEADAYAHFAGKMLPTVYHWERAAASVSIYSEVLELSNFGGKGPKRVSESKAIGPFGTYDMAGNVKEWMLNASGDRHYILGGAWNEPNYQFQNADARLPFDRSANNGIRTIKPADATPIAEPALRSIERLQRDYSREKPVGDDLFQAYARMYSYDRTDLKAVVESRDDSSPFWRVERITYGAAYGDERIAAYLFLPKHVGPPYQTVVYFPHGSSLAMRRFEQGEMSYLGFMVKAGRALLLPMYKGTYERLLPRRADGPSAVRDLRIQQVKDLSRSIDYVMTREDLDHARVAFFGVSYGANVGPLGLALDDRLKTAVLWSGGLETTPVLPEVDLLNFAPRVTMPVLMLNGRDDFAHPIDTSQEPLFQLLGASEAHKRRVLYDGGHVFPFLRLEKDTLEWLDKYMGIPR